jgi:hypothetical protein
MRVRVVSSHALAASGTMLVANPARLLSGGEL